jgi:mono/diheme cytochrome c family protein
MRSEVKVVTAKEYTAWLAKATARVKASTAATAAAAKLENAPGDVAAGKTVFEAKCSGCHADLGKTAGVGPAIVGTALTTDQIRDQIKNGKGAMPGGLATGTDLADVVAFVESIK